MSQEPVPGGEGPSRRTLVLLAASVIFPLATVVVIVALEGESALRFVMVGVGVMTLITAWATSGMDASANTGTREEPRSDHAAGRAPDGDAQGS